MTIVRKDTGHLLQETPIANMHTVTMCHDECMVEIYDGGKTRFVLKLPSKRHAYDFEVRLLTLLPRCDRSSFPKVYSRDSKGGITVNVGGLAHRGLSPRFARPLVDDDTWQKGSLE